MITYNYHCISSPTLAYHFIFDIKTFNCLLNETYANIKCAFGTDILSARRLVSMKIETYKERGENILHKTALLNLQYSLLKLSFCLCIKENLATPKFAFKLCLYDAADLTSPTVNLDNLPIDLIANRCFHGNTILKTLTLPNSVSEIGVACFDGCTSLESITLPKALTYLSRGCFKNCSALKNVILPDSLTEIASSCFRGCSNLENILIPDSVLKLGHSCFYSCSKLQNVILSNNIEIINYYCFSHCVRLESIILPNNLQNLGNFCFQNCENLKEVILPKNFTFNSSLDYYGLTSATKIMVK